jgi:hypothetical protein
MDSRWRNDEVRECWDVCREEEAGAVDSPETVLIAAVTVVVVVEVEKLSVSIPDPPVVGHNNGDEGGGGKMIERKSKWKAQGKRNRKRNENEGQPNGQRTGATSSQITDRKDRLFCLRLMFCVFVFFREVSRVAIRIRATHSLVPCLLQDHVYLLPSTNAKLGGESCDPQSQCASHI